MSSFQNKQNYNIAIIGIGGIGFRHLQSCVNLPPSSYSLYAIDVNPTSLQKVTDELKDRDINCLPSINQLPSTVDVAIIATQANVRAQITKELLMKRKVASLILEKVLFQKIKDYELISTLLLEHKIPTFVNCPRRLWPGYKTLSHFLGNNNIEHISISGSGWDLGCNAIHFIDLISFLCNDCHYQINKSNLLNISTESKRAGSYAVKGDLWGTFDKGCSFFLSTTGKSDSSKEILIKTKSGINLQIEETPSELIINYHDDKCEKYPIPFQSQLTSDIIKKLINNNNCDLAQYQVAQFLHLPIIKEFSLHFKKYFPELSECPIT